MADNLRQKAVSGAIWKFGETGLINAFTFVQGIILARLLSPGDYGLVAMVGVFTSIAAMFVSSGLGLALVQKQNKTKLDYSTVFDCNIGIAFIALVVLCSCSGLIADFYNEPILVKIVCLEAFILFLNSSFGIQSAKFFSDLRFREGSIINIVCTIICGIAGIVMAFAGFGVYSLIYPEFIRFIIKTVMYWHYQHWFPGFKFSKKSFKELFGYGSQILFSNIINVISDNLNSLLIGKVYTKDALGYYNRGSQYSSLVVDTFSGVLYNVSYPILSKIQDDNDRLRDAYRRMIRLASFITFPMMIGLAVVAHPLIIVMISSKWEPSVIYLQILCFGFMWKPLPSLNAGVIQVKGMPQLQTRINFIEKAILVVGTVCAIPFGVIWICIFVAFYNLICVPISAYYNSRLIGMGLKEEILDCVPALVMSAAMGAVVWFATQLFSSDVLKLAVGIPLGAVFYYGVAKITKSEDLEYVKILIKENILAKIKGK